MKRKVVRKKRKGVEGAVSIGAQFRPSYCARQINAKNWDEKKNWQLSCPAGIGEGKSMIIAQV